MRAVKTRAEDRTEQNAMSDDHGPLWRRLIRHVKEQSFADKDVLDCEGFVPLKKRNPYFPRIAESLHYHTVDKTLLGFVKK